MPLRANCEGSDRSGDVLELLFAQIAEGEIKLAGGVFLDARRDTDSARLGERFQPRRDIDAFAENVAALGNHVAEINADAKLDAPLVRHLGLAVDHVSLDLGGAAHRVDGTLEFHQHPVAGGLDGAPLVLPDFGFDELPMVRLQPFVRALLIGREYPATSRATIAARRRVGAAAPRTEPNCRQRALPSAANGATGSGVPSWACSSSPPFGDTSTAGCVTATTKR